MFTEGIYQKDTNISSVHVKEDNDGDGAVLPSSSVDLWLKHHDSSDMLSTIYIC